MSLLGEEGVEEEDEPLLGPEVSEEVEPPAPSALMIVRWKTDSSSLSSSSSSEDDEASV